jgi:hypothetical protein
MHILVGTPDYIKSQMRHRYASDGNRDRHYTAPPSWQRFSSPPVSFAPVAYLDSLVAVVGPSAISRIERRAI